MQESRPRSQAAFILERSAWRAAAGIRPGVEVRTQPPLCEFRAKAQHGGPRRAVPKPPYCQDSSTLEETLVKVVASPSVQYHRRLTRDSVSCSAGTVARERIWKTCD